MLGRSLIGALLWFALSACASAAEPLPREHVEYFETHIRPALIEHCYECHSGRKPQGGLRLDWRGGWQSGGESGPAIVPRRPAESLLIQAIKHENLEMPPKKKMPPAVIARFEQWIRAGAVDPRSELPVESSHVDEPSWPERFAAARQHWSFRPIVEPALPEVNDSLWSRHPIDRLLWGKLAAAGLTPSGRADRRTLIRRAYYDLWGLPPTFDEVAAFEQDESPEAFAKLIDRLLASPHYGERWGRHWLDVARYADTKDGVLMYGDDRIRPYAYTYREYVIEAFNRDVPFDRFVHEQLAADQLATPSDGRSLAAMGFLTLGRMFDNNMPDVIDDRIDVVTRGLLGLTVSCARCHDHKYDAIPTADYYALYGVFASSEAPLIPPLLDESQRGPEAFAKQFAAKEAELRDMLEQQYALLSAAARSRVSDYLVHVATTKADPLETAIFFLSLAPSDLRPPIVARWRSFLARRAQADDPVFGPWHALLALDHESFSTTAPAVLEACLKQPNLNALVRAELSPAKLQSMGDVARRYGTLLKRVDDESKQSKTPLDAARQELLAIVSGPDSPAYFPKSQTRQYMSRGEKDSFGNKLKELDKLAVKEPLAPPRAMSLIDSAEINPQHVFVRGNAARLGERVPRRFLQAISDGDARPFTQGSGRLELARAITAPQNPLTSRVLVNRVWMHHFGEPLVLSPSDFGTRSSPPVQGELLDHLSRWIQQHDWSLKQLHRHIMTSQAYQQASLDDEAKRRADPENRLLWRMNRRRLDLEAMRDTYLAVSLRLDPRLGGRGENLAGDPLNRRRTVYGLVDRQSLPGIYRVFDFAVPDQSVERRPLTTVPQQSLFGLNAPFMLEQAKALAERTKALGTDDVDRRVTELYRCVLQRAPDRHELEVARRFVQAPLNGSQLDAWQQYAQVLLLANETLFID